jgi:hypothetical protein
MAAVYEQAEPSPFFFPKNTSKIKNKKWRYGFSPQVCLDANGFAPIKIRLSTPVIDVTG